VHGQGIAVPSPARRRVTVMLRFPTPPDEAGRTTVLPVALRERPARLSRVPSFPSPRPSLPSGAAILPSLHLEVISIHIYESFGIRRSGPFISGRAQRTPPAPKPTGAPGAALGAHGGCRAPPARGTAPFARYEQLISKSLPTLRGFFCLFFSFFFPRERSRR